MHTCVYAYACMRASFIHTYVHVYSFIVTYTCTHLWPIVWQTAYIHGVSLEVHTHIWEIFYMHTYACTTRRNCKWQWEKERVGALEGQQCFFQTLLWKWRFPKKPDDEETNHCNISCAVVVLCFSPTKCCCSKLLELRNQLSMVKDETLLTVAIGVSVLCAIVTVSVCILLPCVLLL